MAEFRGVVEFYEEDRLTLFILLFVVCCFLTPLFNTLRQAARYDTHTSYHSACNNLSPTNPWHGGGGSSVQYNNTLIDRYDYVSLLIP